VSLNNKWRRGEGIMTSLLGQSTDLWRSHWWWVWVGRGNWEEIGENMELEIRIGINA
jgi:hypothetical protein